MAHATMDDLQAALPRIEAAPAEGTIRAIVVRPEKGAREMPGSNAMSLAAGMHGDHWSKGCWRETEDGAPHPDVQICLMPARVIEAFAGPDTADWGPAGDNLFIDMDLSPGNCPPGTRLAMGSAEIVITEEPHNGCQGFIDRYGRDACVFVNTGRGRDLRLRGIYGRVVRDGTVSVGDSVRKVEA
ncbi:MOSC domain-containing protein [Psychromarinibacter sp. S121]|uniref:MOSC domain-containing protein n=1 Tax=Psychromarinibacter sp. S121 TaxID=3415127 RepID=UPI003C7CA5D2